MEKKSSLVIKICDFVIKYFIFVAVMLVPLFYLPFTSDAFDFNKNILLIFLVFIALFCWMIKSLVAGKMEIKKSSALTAVGIFFLVFLLSTIFSIDKYGSFWGNSQVISGGMMSATALCVFYFLVSNAFFKKDVWTLVLLIAISAIISQLLSVATLFNPYFGFGYSNTIGSTGGLGIFSAIFLPLTIIFLITAKKWWRVLFSVGIFLSAVLFILIDYSAIWWVVLIGSVILLAFSIVKRKFFDARWMALPVFFLAVSLFFLIFNPQIGWMPRAQGELSLTQKTNFQIDSSALSQTPILGSGPATFSYDFLKFKGKELSATQYWNVVFSKGTSKILTYLAEIGILGTLAFLAVMLLTIYLVGNFLFFEKEQENEKWLLTAGLFMCFIALSVAFFLYPSNLTLDFIFFLLAGLLINISNENSKEYALKPNSLLTLGLVFLFTLIFIFSIGLLVIQTQRYIAEIYYSQGLVNWQKGNTDKAISEIETAISYNANSDIYFSQLSQAFILKLQKDISDSKLTSDQRTKEIQTYVANSINSAKLATDLSPKNANDWSVRGYIYQNLVGFSSDTETWAENSYKQAISLDPFNPYLETQLGILYYNKKDYTNAMSQFKTAIALNANYSTALYYLGLTYDAQGDKANAITQFTNLLKVNQADTTVSAQIQKIIDNLKAGNSALAGTTQAISSTTPPTGTPSTPTK